MRRLRLAREDREDGVNARLTMGCSLPDEETNGGGSTQVPNREFWPSSSVLVRQMQHSILKLKVYHDIDASQANARAAQVRGRTLGCCAKVLPRSTALGPESRIGYWTSLSFSQPHRWPTHILRCHQRANCGLTR